MADSGCSGSWWGGWLQTAKEKSASALDFMKKDLSEFTNVMQKDTAVAAGTVKEKLTQENASEATRKMKDGVTSLLGGISKALVIEAEDKHYRGEPITVDTHIFDRAKARLHAIQLDPATYCSDPSGSREEFDQWVGAFVLEDQKGAISELLVSNVQVRSLYTQLVPSEVSHAHFWQRYFYKVYQLEQDEARKAALKRRADAGAQEAELEWDDDEWGDLESGAPITPSSAPDRTKLSEQTSSDSSTSADNHLPQVTLSASDTTDSSSDSLKSVPSSDSTQEKQSTKTEAQPTLESVTPEKIQGAPSVRPESKAPETSTSAIESESESRTLTTENAAEQPASTTAEGDKESTKIGEKAETTEQSSGSDSTTEEPEVVQVIPATRDKGDLVLVGSDRNTPSSDSSQSKELSSVDDDWEKDFDIEVSEEDIRLAQAAARKLADEGVSPADEDDDWENWD